MNSLILGGVRSGKSRYAETLAHATARAVTCIATATPGDAEMQRRIDAHRARRPRTWALVEEPLALASALQKAAADRCIIVDCLTLWLTNLLLLPDTTRAARERAALLDALDEPRGDIIFVSNETGMGVVPLGELARRFGDAAGELHQELARRCDRVVLMVAGLPVALKGTLP